MSTTSVEFDQDEAQKYDERDTVRVLSQAVLKKVLEPLDWYQNPPQKIILDFGCGTGRNAIAMAQQGHQVIGCDVSEHMLDMFRTNLLRQDDAVKDRVTLIHSDHGRHLPVAAYDAACVFLVLHHVQANRQHEVIVNLAKALKNGGCLVVVEFEDTKRSRAIRESFQKERESSSHHHGEESDESTKKSHDQHSHDHSHHHHNIEWMNRQTLKSWMEATGLNVSQDQLFEVQLQEGIMDCYYMIGTRQEN